MTPKVRMGRSYNLPTILLVGVNVKLENPEKTSGNKYGQETKCTYSAGIGDRTRAQWCTLPGKNCYSPAFPLVLLVTTTVDLC